MPIGETQLTRMLLAVVTCAFEIVDAQFQHLIGASVRLTALSPYRHLGERHPPLVCAKRCLQTVIDHVGRRV